MAKRKLKLVAQRVFSAMLSLLLRARRTPPCSSSLKPSAGSTPNGRPPPVQRDGCPPPPATAEDQKTTLVVDVDTALLLSSSSPGSGDGDGNLLLDVYFPYFMLVALEAGGFLRGLVLLLLYPPLRLLPTTTATAVMAAVAFCGLRASRFRAGRAVLPKWFMEDVAAEAFEAATRGTKRRMVCVTGMPRVMVDGFLREYLGAEVVVGREMGTLWGFYTGLFVRVEEDEGDHRHRQQLGLAVTAEEENKNNNVVGFSGSPEFLNHPLVAACCKEVYVVSPAERRRWRALPREKHPKPVVFHDGRLAFRPTAGAAAAMFAWLPFGVALGAARLAVALALPYTYSTPILAATGMSWRLKGPLPSFSSSSGQLLVCNHRTLIDPVYVSVALGRRVRAVSYSLSRFADLLSPIGRTVRLARDRRRDGAAMAALLSAGDLVVVCPEGTTCREPYLLRFSPLFAELADGVVPVGVAVETSMFYATTAGGLKCLDPIYYMVNPRMCYTVQFMEKVDTSRVREGKAPSADVANLVQTKMGRALGYGCTMLTRKDKYRMLAGNDGIVVTNTSKSAGAAAATGGKKVC